MNLLPSLRGPALCVILLIASAPTYAAEPEPEFLGGLVLPNLEDSIGYPQAVVSDPSTGEVFVCDSRKNRVIIFDGQGLFRYQIPGGDVFSAPVDIAVDSEGYLVLLANHGRRQALLELDFDGLMLREIRLSDTPEMGVEPFFASTALSPSGRRIYLLDQANLWLWVVDRSGRVRSVVDLASGFDEREKRDLILGKVDAYGDRVLVAIPSSGEIRIFDLDGKLVGHTGIRGTAPCQIGFPMAAAMDVDGKLLIVDQQRMFLVRWDPAENRCLGEYAGPGAAPGYLYYPLDIGLDPAGRVYVSQGYDGRVQVYTGFPGALAGGAHPEATVGADSASSMARSVPIDPAESAASTVKQWARARTEFLLEEYLSYYSADFQPSGFGDRQAWQDALRVGPDWAETRIADLEVKLIRKGFARATFAEVVRTRTEQDPERKVLLLRRERDGWKILEERVAESP